MTLLDKIETRFQPHFDTSFNKSKVSELFDQKQQEIEKLVPFKTRVEVIHKYWSETTNVEPGSESRQ